MYHETPMLKRAFANTSLLCIQVEPSTRDSQLGMIRIPVNYPGERFRNQVFNVAHGGVWVSQDYFKTLAFTHSDVSIQQYSWTCKARPVIFCRCLQSYIRLQQQS